MPNWQQQLTDRDQAVSNSVIPIAQITLAVDLLGSVIEYETNRYGSSGVAGWLQVARDALTQAYAQAENRFQEI